MRKSDQHKSGNHGVAVLKRRTRMLALEPRMMFDGALAADVASTAVHSDAPARPVETPPAIAEKPANERLAEQAPGASKMLVFIDYRVADANQLLAGADPAATVVTIGAGDDGVHKIADVLAQTQNVASVQIISHGGPGFLELGATKLDQQALAGAYASVVAGWREALTANGDILLLGCDVANGSQGAAFVAALAAATGADVAASTGPTGAAALGGNWTLESATGSIESRLALAGPAMDAYAGLLATPVIADAVTAARAVAEDTPLTISGITIADADPLDTQMVTLNVLHGTVTLANLTGLSGVTGNGTATVMFTGSLADVNAAINGMTYAPMLDYNGGDTLTVNCTDSTLATATPLTAAIAITAVNDSPTLAPAALAVQESAANVAFSALNLGLADVDITSGQQVLAQMMVEINSLP